ncbi:MAG: IS3 family transposase [Anaerococcus obesiensis]
MEKYIRWYNEDRIKTKLNGMSPVMYRLHSA